MYIYVTKDLFESIEDEAFWKLYGISGEGWRWRDSTRTGIHLPSYGRKSLERFRDRMAPLQMEKGKPGGVRGTKTIVQDINRWLKAISGEGVKPRSMEQFDSLLNLELRRAGEQNAKEGRPHGPRVYKHDDERDVWYCYYVARTEYQPAVSRDYHHTPAHTNLYMVYMEFEEREVDTCTFWGDDIRGMTALESLAKAGLILETQEMWDEYKHREELFGDWTGKVGKQFLATGIGSDDCDGNKKSRQDSWYWRRTNHIQLDKNDEPSRVVCDVFFEEDKSDRNSHRYSSNAHTDRLYWYRKKRKKYEEDWEDEDLTEDVDADIDPDDVPEPFIPIHPTLAVFEMRRHQRLRVDVGQLTEYEYDSRLGDKLVLPSDSRNLVEMLLAHRGQFRDIVKGKSGGAVILCAGIPGTGKTLTAEVYAEVMHKPLYTVQASQLGTDADALEDELMKTFARATRWGAIMLLDEADVYVHSRGDDLEQNAIVGVFLRVLEYYKGVLFMTTNRSDLVDDAIGSRCVARIDYKVPTVSDQKAIWRILADTAGVKLGDDVITAAAERYPDLTGRDVKNLLKLGQLISSSRECPITLDVIRFAKRFKPTVTSDAKVYGDDDEVTLPPMPIRELPTTMEATDAASATETTVPKVESISNGNWREAVVTLFGDGAPHAASEVKEIVKGMDPAVHPNAVTNVLVRMVRAGELSRLDSGLYRREA